ncbi:MAG: tetratricopeptide repeat protein [Planctomycetota bacterium]
MVAKNRKRSGKPKRRRRVGVAVRQSQTKQLERRARNAFFEDGDTERALALLRQAESKGALSYDGLDTYLDVLHEYGDLDDYARIALTTVDRYPDDPNANMLAGSACFSTLQPVSAILYFEKVISLAPNHPGLEVAEEQVTKLREHLPEILDAFVDELPKDLPRIASAENILHFFTLSRFDEVIRRCQVHLRDYPEDVRIRNNYAEALALRGDQSDALEVLSETIRLAPTNFYAHAARSLVLFLLNRRVESEADAQKLRSLVPKQISDLTKAARTFAVRGDAAGIEWAYELAKRSDWLDDESSDTALLLHYEATRLARADDLKQAKSLWKRANTIAGSSVLAGENLEDLRLPVDERNGPFYCDLTDWLNHKQQKQTRSLANAIHDDDSLSEATTPALIRDFLSKNKDLEHLLPDMLDRGDSVAIQFAIQLLTVSSNEKNQAALRAFIEGTHGTDAMRFQVASELHREDVLGSDSTVIYVRGKRDRVEFIDFEITDEPTIIESRGDEIQQLIENGVEHLHAEEGVEAEKVFRQVAKVDDAPDVINNLAMALEIQGRGEEASQLMDELVGKHPDYFFGQIGMANRALQQKNYAAALETLTQLQRRKKLHAAEFVALAKSMIRTYVGRREFPSAQRWLQMLENYDPEHPDVQTFEAFIEFQRGSRNRLSRLLGGK